MKEPLVVTGGKNPLRALYKTPRFKRDWLRTWALELRIAVEGKAGDREIAICARHYILALKAVERLKKKSRACR
jgi:hypothetical protein